MRVTEIYVAYKLCVENADVLNDDDDVDGATLCL
jgi:hypothetical protein